MARAGTQSNQDASKTASATEADQLARANAATSLYNKDLSTLKSGGQISANPWQDPSYLRSMSVQQDAAASGSNDAAAEQLNREAQRTGENTEARKATIAELARQKSRGMMTAQAGQTADDHNRFMAYENSILGNDLAPTGVNTNLYGAATGQANNANTNLAQIDMANQAMWGSVIGSGLQAAGTIGGGFTPRGGAPCWIAEVIYGENDNRTHLLRKWLVEKFSKGFFGGFVVAQYIRFGERIAQRARRSRMLRLLLKPIFDLALTQAERWIRLDVESFHREATAVN